MQAPVQNADNTIMLFAALLIAAVTVKQPDAPLRSGGCDKDAALVARLPGGVTVEVRSSVAGADGACYRVSAQVEGKALYGNIPGSALEGLDDFDQARRMSAGAGDSVQMTTARQVESLRQILTGAGGNPDALVRAGIAAWKSDQIGLALEHWRAAQSIRPPTSARRA